jgi:hypothetical protein
MIKKDRVFRWTIGSPLFLAILSVVFFSVDVYGHNGLIYVAILCWAMGVVMVVVRWKKMGRVHAVSGIVLLALLALVAGPNW